MATGILALLDDISTLMDDIAILSKKAATKTAGVVTDDLAVGAEQVSNFASSRELPIVFKVGIGSMLNKVILVPLALLMSYFAPWAIPVMLIMGGLYLCYEGAEKITEMLQHGADVEKGDEPDDTIHHEDMNLASEKYKQYENKKVKAAIRTDFVLSAEIIVIALGTMAGKPLMSQVLSLSLVAILMTVGVYALVGLLVKLDDMGFWLQKKTGAIAKTIGAGMVAIIPFLMKGLSWGGTLAMFLVGGGIFVEHVSLLEPVHHAVEPASFLIKTPVLMLVGFVVGFFCVPAHHAVNKLLHK